jgi:hypothetical protein
VHLTDAGRAALRDALDVVLVDAPGGDPAGRLRSA